MDAGPALAMGQVFCLEEARAAGRGLVGAGQWLRAPEPREANLSRPGRRAHHLGRDGRQIQSQDWERHMDGTSGQVQGVLRQAAQRMF